MAARDREEILTRYRRLREISTRHHSEALRFIPRSVLLGQARRLGLTAGKMLVADSMDELTLAFDLCLYTAAPGRSRGIVITHPPHRNVFMLSNQQLTPISSRCRVESNRGRDTSRAASREVVLVASSGTLLA